MYESKNLVKGFVYSLVSKFDYQPLYKVSRKKGPLLTQFGITKFIDDGKHQCRRVTFYS